jgi:hypothetical protein
MEQQEQEAQASTQQQQQEAAAAQPSAPESTTGSRAARQDESPEQLKSRLNAEAKALRELMEAERAAREKTEAELRALKDAQKAAELEAQRKEMTDLERARSEAEEYKAKLAQERELSNQQALQLKATDIAAELRFHNPAMAARLVDPASVITNGSIDPAALRLHLDDLRQKNPWLAVQEAAHGTLGPTNSPSGIQPRVQTLDLKQGEHPSIEYARKMQEAALRSRTDPRAINTYIEEHEKLRNSDPRIRQGKQWGSPPADKGG